MFTTSFDDIMTAAECTFSADGITNDLHLSYEMQEQDFIPADAPVGWERYVHGDWCRRTVAKLSIRKEVLD